MFLYSDLKPTAVFLELSEFNKASAPIPTLNSPFVDSLDAFQPIATFEDPSFDDSIAIKPTAVLNEDSFSYNEFEPNAVFSTP